MWRIFSELAFIYLKQDNFKKQSFTTIHNHVYLRAYSKVQNKHKATLIDSWKKLVGLLKNYHNGKIDVKTN